jgi:hypothetical protein
MKKVLIPVLIILALTGCTGKNVEEAKKVFAEDGAAFQVIVLFDNSRSYKSYVDLTLKNVTRLFQHLAREDQGDEHLKTSLILIDTKASILFNGNARDLQAAYDKVAKALKDGQSDYTDLTEATQRALYFLKQGKAKRKIIVIFSDMKASTPKYYPTDKETVPPPPDFPWEELKKEKIEVYAFCVPLPEWKLWEPVAGQKGLMITERVPEDQEIQAGNAYRVIFEKEE